MRTIRFRGKRDGDGGWTYGQPVPVTKRDATCCFIVSDIRGGSVQGFPVDPETVGQFTGMQDVNGKDIYEGDIVRYRWTDDRYRRNPRYMTREVVWDAFYGRWGLKDCLGCVFRPNRLEVLGNVFDNPELMR